MPLLAWLGRLLLLRRLFGGRTGRRARRGRRSDGFGLFGPVPVYSRRTRGGSRVSVGGCCLPIPLALGAVLAGALRLLHLPR